MLFHLELGYKKFQDTSLALDTIIIIIVRKLDVFAMLSAFSPDHGNRAIADGREVLINNH